MKADKLRSLSATVVLATSVFAAQANAQDGDTAAQANNPLADSTALNFQNVYSGELTGVDEDANQFNIRYAKPFSAFGGEWLMRATVPVNTLPDATGDHDTGLGDINVFAAYLIDTGNPAVSFGFGPQISLPTASEDNLGTGKYSLGFANVLFNATSKKFQWGYLLTWQASVAGDDDREDVNVGAFQPFGFYQLGQGWYLRSAGIWTYNFQNDNYSVPIGFGAGRVIPLQNATLNAFIEPQYSVASRGDGLPEWSVFAGLNFQF